MLTNLKARPMFLRWQMLAVGLVILAVIGLAAFQEGTFINAVFFGKCESTRSGPPVCDSMPYDSPPLGGF